MAMEPQSNNQPPLPTPPAGGTQNPPPGQNLPAPNPPKAEPKGSIYDDLGIQDPSKGGAPALWPEDWRTQFAGENKDVAERFKRFDSPAALAKSYIALEQRLRSGEYKRSSEAPDPEKNPAEYAEWRKEAGLPEKAEEYSILPETVRAEDLDADAKVSISKFQGMFHRNNVPPQQAKAMAQGIFEIASEQMAQQADADAKYYDETEDTLRADWGNDYRNNLMANLNHAKKLFGDDVGPQLFEARMPDGRKLGSLPIFSKALNQWARSEGGDVLYDASGSAAKTVDSRISEIEKVMGSNMNTYLSTPGMADEYTKLLEKRSSRKG